MEKQDSFQGRRVFITGGAGFIGSHFVDELLCRQQTQAVTIFDNFSSGRRWHFEMHLNDSRFKTVEGDIKDADALETAMAGHDLVIHLASNPDIARAITEPSIDFIEGTLLTQRVLEAMRKTSVKTLIYSSGSGVYGDLGFTDAREDHGPLLPESTYGASKIAGESMICGYSAMFGIKARAFRFGNVIGPRQTHGVGYDFVRRLLKNPSYLKVMGDGTQSKSYIHVSDVISAVTMAFEKTEKPYQVYNVATGDYITVREIAELAVQALELDREKVRIEYDESPRGWKGDVPVFRLNTDRIQSLGWKCSMPTKKALEVALRNLVNDAKKGKLGTA